MRSLESRSIRPLWLMGALAMLAGWTWWMVCAKVSVYASTTQARLEVNRMANRVAAQESGRIVTLRVQLGRAVTEGEVLLELDATVEQQRLEEGIAHLASLEPRMDALRRQIAAETEVRASRAHLNALATQRGAVTLEQAQAAATHEEELGAISDRLSENELLSRADKVKADSEVVDSRLKVKGAELEVVQLGATRQYDDKAALARIAELERQLADLGGEEQATRAAVETGRAQLERRKVCAPAAGKLGNIAPLQIGDVLKVGDVIATVIPSDDIHMVAEFAPSDAVGRVLPNQQAWVRLNGFSWTQFGMLEAVVTHVASEPRDGTVRVELLVSAGNARAIPIQHGLPGSVDVEVEQVSPWRMLVRSVGSVVGRPSAPGGGPSRLDVARAPS